ncbi:retrovirus-related pol polyprotein from transposon TNT 1-94 [Tanacetum coccineum]
MKGSSVWSVRYHVDTDDFMTPLPEGWSIRSTVWSIVLGEREDDSFLVINLSGKVVEYNLISKNLREMYDMGSNQLTDDYHDGFIPPGFIPPFAMYDMRPKQVDHKVFGDCPKPLTDNMMNGKEKRNPPQDKDVVDIGMIKMSNITMPNPFAALGGDEEEEEEEEVENVWDESVNLNIPNTGASTPAYKDHSCGGYEPNIAMRDFKECVQKMEVVDVNAIGLYFTWNQKMKGSNGVGIKSLLNAASTTAAHIRVNATQLYMDQDFAHMMAASKHGRIVEIKSLLNVASITAAHIRVNAASEEVSNLHDRVNRLRVELDEAQKAINRNPSCLLLCDEHAYYLMAFKEASLDEERFLRQKSKIEWLNAGDSNTTYFYKIVKRKVSDRKLKVLILIRDDTAHGPDGFTVVFFKKVWDIVGGEVTTPNRDSFSNELMRNYHRKRGPPRCAFKVDIHKAYDTVDWGFLRFGVNHKMTNVVPVPPTDPPNTPDRSRVWEIPLELDSDTGVDARSSLDYGHFETYVKAKDLDLWHIILNGDFPLLAKNKVTQILEVVPFEEQSDDLKKKLAKNNEAKMVLYNVLPKKEYERIFMCKTAKDIWQSLLITHQGFSSKNYVRKFLKALHPKWRAKVTTIEESKDLSSLALDELIGNLKVHEVLMEKDSKIYRGKKERVKSISLKAKKESSDDETSTSGSDDEEYVMAIRNFKKCGDPNHLIGDCPKPSRNKDQKAFIRSSWSDSKNDAKDKTNDETCLMAQSSNEVTLNSSHYSDNASSLDNDSNAWRNMLDRGNEVDQKKCCSKHMVGNKVYSLPTKLYDEGTKWVFRNKLDENGIVSRNKARLVAQGYNQQEGIDYDETYAPIARLESIRILLAIACENDFKLYQMDVKSDFLNGFINEEVYVAQPLGFIDFQKPNYVYKLKKDLYGLKQAPKAWYDRLKAFLIKHEYSIGMVDNTLFTKKSTSHLIIVQIYVDNIIFGSTCQNLCDDFAKIMHDEFEMSMMGELNFFLGLQIKQMEDGIFFNQPKYIKEMLKKFGLEDSKPTKTLMSTKIKLTKDDETDSVDSSKYQGMIGSLLYLTASRPDIMFSVCLCARFQENPKTTHL